MGVCCGFASGAARNAKDVPTASILDSQRHFKIDVHGLSKRAGSKYP